MSGPNTQRGDELPAHPCYVSECDGTLFALVSVDGSCIEAELCRKCQRRWWFQVPLSEADFRAHVALEVKRRQKPNPNRTDNGGNLHVDFWNAVSEFTAACGGDTSARTTGDRRMNAVVAVEAAVSAILTERRLASARGDVARAARNLVETYWQHRCSDRVGGCAAVSEVALTRLLEALDSTRAPLEPSPSTHEAGGEEPETNWRETARIRDVEIARLRRQIDGVRGTLDALRRQDEVDPSDVCGCCRDPKTAHRIWCPIEVAGAALRALGGDQ